VPIERGGSIGLAGPKSSAPRARCARARRKGRKRFPRDADHEPREDLAGDIEDANLIARARTTMFGLKDAADTLAKSGKGVP
jgi:hypothetical protein